MVPPPTEARQMTSSPRDLVLTTSLEGQGISATSEPRPEAATVRRGQEGPVRHVLATRLSTAVAATAPAMRPFMRLLP